MALAMSSEGYTGIRASEEVPTTAASIHEKMRRQRQLALKRQSEQSKQSFALVAQQNLPAPESVPKKGGSLNQFLVGLDSPGKMVKVVVGEIDRTPNESPVSMTSAQIQQADSTPASCSAVDMDMANDIFVGQRASPTPKRYTPEWQIPQSGQGWDLEISAEDLQRGKDEGAGRRFWKWGGRSARISEDVESNIVSAYCDDEDSNALPVKKTSSLKMRVKTPFNASEFSSKEAGLDNKSTGVRWRLWRNESPSFGAKHENFDSNVVAISEDLEIPDDSVDEVVLGKVNEALSTRLKTPYRPPVELEYPFEALPGAI
eukprot:TRINITY_DN101844_c0_g1_i1.p1 TRINITY_DN101844_c0_g1~~TRINITY_DN101844_c0_g1_i1.p1  ORF type:complete len:316 (+),score=70.96 TRINITY_DN101844_c0_g1_i1:96-1043(+)